MSKANQALSTPVKKLLRGVGVKVMTYSELKSKSDFLDETMDTMQATYSNELNIIGIDDNAMSSTEDVNELVLHELIHFTAQKLDRIHHGTTNDYETEDATAQIGMFKLILVLGINPAPYQDKVVDYLKQLPEANFEKAHRDSDKAMDYLVRQIGLERVA